MAVRRLQIRGALPALTGLLIAVSLAGCEFVAIGKAPFGEPESVAETFPGSPNVHDRDYTIEGHRVHYVEMSGGPTRIVFIDGTPGDWSGWADYLKQPALQACCTLIAVDRPGFGESSPGKTVPSIVDQARLLRPLLNTDDGSKVLLIGHSLGGPIAGEMALDYPDEVRGAVLVAPSIAPEYEHAAWYNYLLAWLPVDWAIRDMWVWSNREMMPLHRELVTQSTRWSTLKVPVTVVQGDKDDLVDPRTADFAEQVLPKPQGKVIRAVGQNHFVLWQQPQIVLDAIIETLNRSAAESRDPKP